MKKIIPLIIIITMALFLTGCADVFIQVETDGKGNLLTETYEILSQDSTIGTQLSSGIAEAYKEYNDRQKQCVTVDYYRREAPFGGKIHIDHKKARDLSIELTDTSIAFEDINYGIVDGIEFVTYRIPPPDPDQADQIISGTGFLTITTSMPGREDHQFGRGLEKVLKEGVYYTVRSDGTEETLKLSIFEDPNLEQVFRESIDKPTGPLHKTDLEGITILDACEREIESLDGIQYIQNLQKLNFSSNQVSDISLLANLTNLEWLEFSDNQVSDISALVLNEGLGSGDIINMENNYLDLTSGSQNMQDIETLINRGVDVIYEPQPVPNPTIELVPKTFDLRDIVKTDEKEQIIQFSVLNTGDADLVIEEIVMENIFSFNREIPLTLEPGEQIHAEILLDASPLKEGEFRKAIRIITNDPQNHKVFLRITGIVR
jgi:hypothetical protein